MTSHLGNYHISHLKLVIPLLWGLHSLLSRLFETYSVIVSTPPCLCITSDSCYTPSPPQSNRGSDIASRLETVLGARQLRSEFRSCLCHSLVMRLNKPFLLLEPLDPHLQNEVYGLATQCYEKQPQ